VWGGNLDTKTTKGAKTTKIGKITAKDAKIAKAGSSVEGLLVAFVVLAALVSLWRFAPCPRPNLLVMAGLDPAIEQAWRDRARTWRAHWNGSPGRARG